MISNIMELPAFHQYLLILNVSLILVFFGFLLGARRHK